MLAMFPMSGWSVRPNAPSQEIPGVEILESTIGSIDGMGICFRSIPSDAHVVEAIPGDTGRNQRRPLSNGRALCLIFPGNMMPQSAEGDSNCPWLRLKIKKTRNNWRVLFFENQGRFNFDNLGPTGDVVQGKIS